MAVRDVVQAAAGQGGGDKLYVEDVFSTYLYTGNGSTQTITNGIDLDGEGGLVWFKNRQTVDIHALFDSERPLTNYLRTNGTNAEGTGTTNLAFNSNGFSFNNNIGFCNTSGQNYASWTFRKAPKFFDVVTYTGNGTTNDIAHSLDSVPGFVVIKKTSTTSNWYTLNRKSSGDYVQGYLNSTGSLPQVWTSANTSNYLTSTTLKINALATVTSEDLNASGVTYVAYLFAHDAGGFGDDGTENVISCGSYVGNNVSGGQFINLGYEAQWVLTKNATGSANDWHIQDVMRGATVPSTTYSTALGNVLRPNSSIAEYESTNAYPAATGFYATGDDHNNGTTYIYIAIRRPMKTPESGTEVFAIDYQGTGGVLPGYKAPFPVDMGIWRDRDTVANTQITTRMTHDALMYINLNNEETTARSYSFDYQNGWFDSSTPDTTRVGWMFRRAPGFFDVVGYKGDAISGRTVTHNLGVAPELMIIKNRGQLGNWRVYYGDNTRSMVVNSNNPGSSYVSAGYWNNTSPTSSVFTLGNSNDVNSSNVNGYHIAYLFATLPGVSKVGSYTGTGTTQTIDCGFSSGARFVLIKRENVFGDWYLWDSLRGIVAGNDPYLLLNLQDAETTATDYIDPVASGFQISSSAPSSINGGGNNFIFLAIA